MTTSTTNFGRDTLCVDSRKTGRYASGKRLLAQRLVHRLTTRKGQLRGGVAERNFGLYLPGLVGATIDTALSGTIGPRIKNELLRDEQVYAVDVTVTPSVSAGVVTWTIEIAVESAVGPFALVLTVDQVTVKAVYQEAA